MDISKLSQGAKLVLGGSIAFLIVSVFNWQEVEFAGIASAGRSMWSGIGVIAGLLAIAIVVWEGLRLANVKLEFGIPHAMVTAGLSFLLVLFTVIKFLADGEFRTFWAWLGLLLSIVVAVGGFLHMKDSGLSMGDMKTQMAGAAASASAAARSAADSVGDRRDDTPATPAPTPTAPETTPVDSEPADDPGEHRPA